jgi:peptidoglycan lytic transglycosylase
MAQISQLKGVTAPLVVMLTTGAFGLLASAPLLSAAADVVTPRADPKPQPDLSGRERTGVASFYADRFAGRKMADGNKMDPQCNNAASRTLPLGTVAKVTNLATRKSAVVTIQDRGPYVHGRIVDLSPSTARKIGITPKIGIAKVRVTPIVVPLPDGRIKLASAGPNPQPCRSASAGSTAGTTMMRGGA